jgi:hypothetical protein
VLILTKNGWATFWATFSKTNLVTLLVGKVTRLGLLWADFSNFKTMRIHFLLHEAASLLSLKTVHPGGIRTRIVGS